MIPKMRSWSLFWGIVVLALLTTTSPKLVLPVHSSPSLQAPPGVEPQNHVWPLPSVGQEYWWVFEWAGDSSCTGKKVGIWATHFEGSSQKGDGAFQREDLISINFLKDAACAYWGPGTDHLFRWYSRGFVQVSDGVQDIKTGGMVDSFLSFRGHSEWCPDRGLNNLFKDGSTTHFTINGVYTYTCANGAHSFQKGYRYGRYDGEYMALYASVPDRPFTANTLRLDSSVGPNANRLRFPGGSQGWSDLRQCSPTAATCAGSTVLEDAAWFVTWRAIPTSEYTFHGKQVQYAGFSETAAESGSIGACEEWWFAEDIGPIYLIKYPRENLANCMAKLNGTDLRGFLSNPVDQISRASGDMIGYLRPASLTPPYSWCLSGGCKVEW
jgi:hypothetical protein